MEIKLEKQKYLVWRYGVILKDNQGGLALVREDGRTFSVAVKGKDKTNYISDLRNTLNDIFNSYKSDKPELLYRVERFGEIPDESVTKSSLWLADRKIINHYQREKPYYDDATDLDIPNAGVVNKYNIRADSVITGGQGHQLIKNTFKFRECNIGLHGNLNDLAQLLAEDGKKEDAKELENIANVLEQTELSSKEDVKKKGLANRLKRLVQELENKDSKLHKTVKGIKNGISITQDIANAYNSMAQWAGLPTVPKPF